jgi:hypothetical protein
MFPEWLEWFRVCAAVLIWIMFPLQLWATRNTLRQFRQWEQAEVERRARWAQDMAAAAQMREEAYHLRAQAEVALAQARRPLLKDGGD